MKAGRSQRGALLGLVAASATVLTIVLAAFFVMAMLLGGNRELSNATDAGTLNLGKKIFTHEEFKVKRNNSSFADLADKNGEFGLANINAVWGKMLLVQANAQAMQTEGLAGASQQNADRLFQEADSINSELANKLASREAKAPIFEELARKNSLRMLGPQQEINAADNRREGWQISFMDRGLASNIEASKESLPSEASFAALHTINGHIPGYSTIKIGKRSFSFVPFAENQKNHLVSLSDFKANLESTKALPEADWSKPIGNAFSSEGSCTDNLGLTHYARACVLANPQKFYKLSLPHSFIHIKLEENQAKWKFNSPDPRVGGFNVSLVEKESGYDRVLDPSRKSGGGGSAIDGELTGNLVPLGSEYTLNPSLDKAIFGSALEHGNTGKLEQALVTRINQMISARGKTFSVDDLHKLLSRPDTGAAMQGAGVKDFYIYSANGAEIEVKSRAEALIQAPWLASIMANAADGTEANSYAGLSSDKILPPGIISINPLPGANIVVPPFGRMNIEIKDHWQPGSGADGCLGDLRVSHKTTVYAWGVAIIPAAPGAGGLVDRVLDALF